MVSETLPNLHRNDRPALESLLQDRRTRDGLRPLLSTAPHRHTFSCHRWIADLVATPEVIGPALWTGNQRHCPDTAAAELRRLAAVDGGAEVHLVGPGVAAMAREAESDVRQGGPRQCAICRHPGQRDHPASAATAGDLEIVVAERLNVSGQDEGSVIRRLWHGENESRTRRQSQVSASGMGAGTRPHTALDG